MGSDTSDVAAHVDANVDADATKSNPHALDAAQSSDELFDIMLPPPRRAKLHDSDNTNTNTDADADADADPNPSHRPFDIYTDRPFPTGRRGTRAHVHFQGEWHRSVHVWIVDVDREKVLMQKRSAHKDTYPDMWDISSAGHVEAGVNDSRETARRELAEELGIVLNGGVVSIDNGGGRNSNGVYDDDDDDDNNNNNSSNDNNDELEFAFTIPAEQHGMGGCNCYEDVYFLRRDSTVLVESSLAIGEAEVSDVRWVDVSTLVREWKRHRRRRQAREDEERIFGDRQEKGGGEDEGGCKGGYVPRVDRYIDAFIERMRDMCEGRESERGQRRISVDGGG